MANPEHLKILKQGVEVWNNWRRENPEVRPDLSEAYLRDAILAGANLVNVDFSKANLRGADMSGAEVCNAIFRKAALRKAKFVLSNLTGAQFVKANLQYTDFSKATLLEVDFSQARLIETIFTQAKITKARIYGISAWNLKKDGLIQKDLIITPHGQPEITVDDLEVAQFIYLMLNNQKIRDVIETITSKAVLILGRFTEERKAVLDALKDELRRRNYLPIVFDFQNAAGKDLDETVNLLARMSRFVIADVTDAKSIPQELKGFVEGNPSIPVLPLILKAQVEYAMFEHFRRYPWVLPLYEYESPKVLLENLIPAIITPAEQKVEELRRK
ncbi:MAG TPA: pentapeptide repeat-containing protein, partial [Saprospiraceae bacterium]|nr:pentapeptide repeat-containing protein [Saprospiraceae bacterium]